VLLDEIEPALSRLWYPGSFRDEKDYDKFYDSRSDCDSLATG